jgi:hypothetical protein
MFQPENRQPGAEPPRLIFQGSGRRRGWLRQRGVLPGHRVHPANGLLDAFNLMALLRRWPARKMRPAKPRGSYTTLQISLNKNQTKIDSFTFN